METHPYPESPTLAPDQSAQLASHTRELVLATIAHCENPERHAYLRAHAEDLEELLLHERMGRWHFLQANIIDGRHFDEELDRHNKEVTSLLSTQEEHVFFRAAIQKWHRQMIEKPLEVIAQNGHVSIAEKLKLLHENHWRWFPVGYALNLAEWEGADQLDAMTAEFVNNYKSAGGDIVKLDRCDAPKEVYFGSPQGDFLPVVRRRTVAQFNMDNSSAEKEPKTYDMSLIKRSAFALDINLAPDVFVKRLGKYIQRSAFIDVQAELLRPSDFANDNQEGQMKDWLQTQTARFNKRLHVEELMRTSQPYLDAHRIYLMREIENLISERSPTMVPLATGYSFKKK